MRVNSESRRANTSSNEAFKLAGAPEEYFASPRSDKLVIPPNLGLGSTLECTPYELSQFERYLGQNVNERPALSGLVSPKVQTRWGMPGVTGGVTGK